jgi:hypothetical protein
MAFDSREFHQKVSKDFSVSLGGAVDLHEEVPFLHEEVPFLHEEVPFYMKKYHFYMKYHYYMKYRYLHEEVQFFT